MSQSKPTNPPSSRYEFESVNPNTYVHHIIYCARCKNCVALSEKTNPNNGRILCYSCYKELLKKT